MYYGSDSIYGKLTPYQSSVNKCWGFVDEDDDLVIDTIYDEVEEFKGAFAKVVFCRETMYIDREGHRYREKPNIYGRDDDDDEE